MGVRGRCGPGGIRSRLGTRRGTRATYPRRAAPVAAAAGVVFAALFVTGCYVRSDQGPGGNATTRETARSDTTAHTRPVEVTPATTARVRPAGPVPKSAFEVAFWARMKRKRKDLEGAMRMLRDGTARYGETPDIYSEMAMVADAKLAKAARGSAAFTQHAKEKLGYLKKTMALIKAGKKWQGDPLNNKTVNLQLRIDEARRAVPD